MTTSGWLWLTSEWVAEEKEELLLGIKATTKLVKQGELKDDPLRILQSLEMSHSTESSMLLELVSNTIIIMIAIITRIMKSSILHP